MPVVEFVPRVGIPHIRFGTTREDVRTIMASRYSAGEPTPRGHETDCFFGASLQFSFENDDTLSFIEAAAPPPVYVRLLGMDTWQLSGDELLEKLKEIDTINVEISEGGHRPVFAVNCIALWDLDEQYDHIGDFTRAKWGAIGIGDERYYSAICKIHGAGATATNDARHRG